MNTQDLASNFERLYYALQDAQKRRFLALKLTNTALRAYNKSFRLSRRAYSKALTKVVPAETLDSVYQKAPWVLHPHSKPRHYLKSGLSLEDFFTTLKSRDINYIVLRWFETLPDVAEGEDIDILIDDADIPKIKDLFGYNRNNQAFDLYAVRGHDGYEFHGASYYPAGVAKNMIANRIWHKDIYAVPNTKHHFLSMAYHVVFHKGEKADLEKKNPSAQSDHLYEDILKDLADKAYYDLKDINYTSLYKILEEEKFTPEIDTIRLLSRKSSLLNQYLGAPPPIDTTGEPIVFILREWVYKHDKLETIENILRISGLEILETIKLNQDQAEKARDFIRGGKWDKGPYPVSGGNPAGIIVCFDYHPAPPTESQKALYPYLANKNALIKHSIRDQLNKNMLLYRHTNALHSSDNAHEAWEYIEAIIPEKMVALENEIADIKATYQGNYKVVYLYDSHRNRAKIEKIEYGDGYAVKKTFKRGQERFLQREIHAYKNFSQIIDTVPPLLEEGDNYFIIPHYENVLEDISETEKKKLIAPKGQEIIDTMKVVYEDGFAMIGFYDGNLIITPDGALQVIDFEFLYPYKTKPDTFEKSYDIIGLPKNFYGDTPIGTYGKGHTYKNTWQSLLGDLSQYI